MKKALLAIAIGLAAWQPIQAAEWVDWTKIQHWAGDPEGENKTALVIDFNDGEDQPALVWGYRWNGKATGEDLLRAIASQSSALTALVQYTGTMGSTINGLGISPKREHLDHLVYDLEGASSNTSWNYDQVVCEPGETVADVAQKAIEDAKQYGVIEHPFNAFVYDSPCYDYDYWQLAEDFTAPENFHWHAGWYSGYWSYYNGSNDLDKIGYSGLGMSSAQLNDGDVHAWLFAVFSAGMPSLSDELDYALTDFGESMHEAEVRTQPVDQNDIKFWVGEGEKSASIVFQFNDGKGPENLVYGYKWTGGWDPTLEEMLKNIAAADTRMALTFNGDIITITYDVDQNGTINDKDHNSVDNTWNIYVKRTIDDKYTKLAKDRTIIPNAVCIVSHQEADTYSVELPYLLFRPALDSNDVITLPLTMEYNLADIKLGIPFFYQLPEGAKVNSVNVSWEKDANINGIIKSISNTNFFGNVSFKDFTPTVGNVYAKIYVTRSDSKGYEKSQPCTLDVKAPVIPVTSVRFENNSYEVGLNKSISNKITYEPTNATYTEFVYSSSNTKAASVNSSTGNVTTTTTAGEATITATYVANSDVTATFTVSSSLVQPVTDIVLEGADESGVITITPKEIFLIAPTVVPADADIKDLNITISENGTSAEDYIATIYRVNMWDENNERYRPYELSGHRVGTCYVTVESTDGSNVSKVFTVNVVDREREPEIDYTEGTFMLNEEWFGHTNGGLNYFTPDYEVVYQAYERENPGQSFGATSQFGTIYGGKLIVCSKQAVDGGDPLPGGGRLVVADAKTLKRLGSIDDLMFGDETKSNDGRACCGAGAGKIYVGTNKSIYIVDLDKIEIIGMVETSDSEGATTNLYNAQIGDMILAGEHVFALQQSLGMLIIDINTDKVIKTIEDANIQGVTQTGDGTIWYATIVDGHSNFVALDLKTLEEIDRVVVPENIGNVTCAWGAWRTTQFTAAKKANKLYFSPGSSVSNGGGGQSFEYDVESKEFTRIFGVTDLDAHTPGIKQGAYGSIRFDDRTNQLVIGTCENKASGHYRYNWTHFVDVATGEAVKSVELRPYYWFQAVPIFPDKYDVELAINDMIDIMIVDDKANDVTIDLTDAADDADNINANIRFSLEQISMAEESEAAESVAEISLADNIVTIHPIAAGEKYFTIAAESNGRIVTKTIGVKIGASGVNDPESLGSISCDGETIIVKGFNGNTFAVYDINGRHIVDLDIDDDYYRARLNVANGAYILHGTNGATAKVVLNR